MTDTPANQAPVKDDAIAHLYGRKGATSGDGFVKFAENQFAHAVGLTASDKGKMPYIDANGDYARLAIGSNGAIVYAASGLPAWLAPGSENNVLTIVSGAPAWSNIATPYRLISTQTIGSAVASVAFTSIPSSGYSRFIMVGTNVVSTRTGVTNEVAAVQVSTDNGSTWKTTSGDYYSSTTASTNLCQVNIPAVDSTFQYSSFVIELVGLGNSARATTGAPIYCAYGISNTSIGRIAIADTTIKMRVAAEADNAVRFLSSSGNNLSGSTNGTISLYGVLE